MKSTFKKEDAARESTPRTAITIEDSRARAYGSEKPEAREIQRAIYGYHPGPFTWRTRRAVPNMHHICIERFLVKGAFFVVNGRPPFFCPQLASDLRTKKRGGKPKENRATREINSRTARFSNTPQNTHENTRTPITRHHTPKTGKQTKCIFRACARKIFRRAWKLIHFPAPLKGAPTRRAGIPGVAGRLGVPAFFVFGRGPFFFRA